MISGRLTWVHDFGWIGLRCVFVSAAVAAAVYKVLFPIFSPADALCIDDLMS